MKGTISVTGTNNTNKKKTKKRLIFNNDAPFRSYITSINNTFMDNAKYVDTVTMICKLLEYSDNYSMTWASLWNYYRDKVIDDVNEINNPGNLNINNNKAITSKFLDVRKSNRKHTSWK